MTRHIEERYIEILQYSLSYVKSLDGFLVKLDSIVYELEDICRREGCDPVSLFRNIISSNELREVLSRFSCYRGEIIESIRNDPRHRILRKYLDILSNVLENIECVEEGSIETVVPPATWVKEEGERIVVEPVETSIRVRYRRWSVDSIGKLLLLVSIVLFIITLILIIL